MILPVSFYSKVGRLDFICVFGQNLIDMKIRSVLSDYVREDGLVNFFEEIIDWSLLLINILFQWLVETPLDVNKLLACDFWPLL